MAIPTIKFFNPGAGTPHLGILDRVGHRVEAGTTASAAVDALPELQFELDVEPFATTSGLSVPGHCALVRTTPDGRRTVVDVVTKDYHPVPMREMARILDPLSTVWTLYAAGQGSSGAGFFLYDRGRTQVGPDPIARFYCLMVPYVAGQGIRALFTGTNMTCGNQLAYVASRGLGKISIPHRKGVEVEVAWYTQLAAHMDAMGDTAVAAFQRLVQTPVTAADVGRMLKAAYPYPAEPQVLDLPATLDPTARTFAGSRAAKREDGYAQACARAHRLREAARAEISRLNDEMSAYARTAWLAWQGVTFCETWRTGRAGGEPELDALFGDRRLRMERAFTVVHDLAATYAQTGNTTPAPPESDFLDDAVAEIIEGTLVEA